VCSIGLGLAWASRRVEEKRRRGEEEKRRRGEEEKRA